jgi:hypothetical protein
MWQQGREEGPQTMNSLLMQLVEGRGNTPLLVTGIDEAFEQRSLKYLEAPLLRLLRA